MQIAASTYLNSAPLIYSFMQGSLRHRYNLIGDEAPSRCATMLADGQAQIALIPIIEYQRIPNLRIIPGVAVASTYCVRSVVIASRLPIANIRRLTLDSSSRTSQTLVKIIFKQRYGFVPQFTERTPEVAANCENMFESSDAALIIGDPAMRVAATAQDAGLLIYDLAEEWRALTGLPFVFAVWAVREDAMIDEPALVHDFVTAKMEGISRIDLLAAQYASELNLPKSELLNYLRENVNYDLSSENIAGLRLYFALAQEQGLIAENHELRFVRKEPMIEVAGAKS